MSRLAQEVGHAVRVLARSPLATGAAILALALGLGATAAVLTVVEGALLSAVPFDDPEELVSIYGERRVDGVEEWPLGYLDFVDWREALVGDTFEALALHTDTRSYNLAGDVGVERVAGEMVSAELARLLGVEMAAGRWFSAEEDATAGGSAVAVIGHDLWQRRFGTSPDVVGESIDLNGHVFTVVGVAEPGFRGMGDEAQVWLPVTMASVVESPPYVELRSFRWLRAVGRLADGVAPDAAQEALERVTSRLEEEHPVANEGVHARITPLLDLWLGDLAQALWTLLAAALFVLAVAVADVAALQLARATARQREMAVRTALGAGRGSLMRQLLVENLLLAGAGVALGLLVAGWLARLLVASSSLELRSFVDLGAGPVVVAASLGLALVAGIAAGIVPALAAARADLASVLKEGGRGSAGGRRGLAQRGLVVAQIALALALAVGAALMAQSFDALRGRDLGFEPDGLISGRIDFKGERWADNAEVAALSEDLESRLGSLPGVESFALTGPGQVTDDWYMAQLTVESLLGTEGGGMIQVLRHHVSPDYFEAMGSELLEGRPFRSSDGFGSASVVVVSEELAREVWPDGTVLGQQMKFGPEESTAPWMTVVGVAEDIEQRGLAGEPGPGPDVYIPFAQAPPRFPSLMNLLVRTDLDASALVGPLRQGVEERAPSLALYDVQPVSRRLDEQTAQERFLALLLSIFAGLALVLAAIGIYGLTAYTVGRRTRELGLRMALGADARSVIGLVTRGGAVLGGLGVALGLVAVLALTRLLESRLHDVSATDPPTLAGAALFLFGVAVIAAWLPARRAARVDPMITLREE